MFGISRQIFIKIRDVKFHENPLCISCADDGGQMDGPTVMRVGMAELIGTFRGCAITPKTAMGFGSFSKKS
jgi:hypothetical protein